MADDARAESLEAELVKSGDRTVLLHTLRGMREKIRDLEERVRDADERAGRADQDRGQAVRDAAYWQRRVAELEKRMSWRAIHTFTRRVDEEWIVPSLSKHYSAHPDGTPYCYSDDPEFRVMDESPSALYPAVVVPKELVGRVIAIRPLETAEGERL